MKKIFVFFIALLANITLYAAVGEWVLKWNEDFTDASFNTNAWTAETVAAGTNNN